MASEKQIRDKVLAYAKSRGMLCIRQHFGGGVTVGYPDDLLLWKRRGLAFVEFKAPNKKPRPIQVYRMQEIRELGHLAIIIDDVEVGKAFIDTMLGESASE
jgi:hypothetical protein